MRQSKGRAGEEIRPSEGSRLMAGRPERGVVLLGFCHGKIRAVRGFSGLHMRRLLDLGAARDGGRRLRVGGGRRLD